MPSSPSPLLAPSAFAASPHRVSHTEALHSHTPATTESSSTTPTSTTNTTPSTTTGTTSTPPTTPPPPTQSQGRPLILTAKSFAKMHLDHMLSHPPDNVLFPFLHGLEGDNVAQNTFFASSSGSSSSGAGRVHSGRNQNPNFHPYPHHSVNQNHGQGHNYGYGHNYNYKIVPKIPEYRGLVWVVCEEDLERAGDWTSVRVLRRKGVSEPEGGQAGAENEWKDQQEVQANFNDMIPPPLFDSSSSEGLDESESDDDESVYEDDEEGEEGLGLEMDMEVDGEGEKPKGHSRFKTRSLSPIPVSDSVLGEDEDGGIAVTTATNAGYAITTTTEAITATATTTSDSTPSSSSSPTPPTLDSDPASEDDADDSVLASPVQMHSQIPVHVRVVVQEEAGDEEQRGFGLEDPAEGEQDIEREGMKDKDEEERTAKKTQSSYEGTHMHPVAHRPAPIGVAGEHAPTSVPPSIPLGVPLGAVLSPVTVTGISATSPDLGVDLELRGVGFVSPLSPPSSTSSSASSVLSSGLSQPQPQPQPLHTQVHTEPRPQYPVPRMKRPTDSTAPPLFTSTFRPKDLIRRVRDRERERKGRGLKLKIDTGVKSRLGEADRNEWTGEGERTKDIKGKEKDWEEGWEFVPARVPDGISLRNFGIQVPIYATLSDIIVYSPYGATEATHALARRFRNAIREKRRERLVEAGLGGLTDGEDEDDDDEDSSDPESADDEEEEEHPAVLSDSEHREQRLVELRDHRQRQRAERRRERENIRRERKEWKEARKAYLKYNVYVLDANEEEMRREMPEMMMRVCGRGVPGALGVRSTTTLSGKGKGEEAGTLTEAEKMDVDMEQGDTGIAPMDIDEKPIVCGPKTKEKEDDLDFPPNTVDFALREREEMRDLTKASEIISLYPEPPRVSSAPQSEKTTSLAPTPMSYPLSSFPFSLASGSGSKSKSSSTVLGSSSIPSSPSFTAAAMSNAPAPARSSIPVGSDGVDEDEPDDLFAPPKYDPRVGQIFLGNSGDVPLAPDVQSGGPVHVSMLGGMGGGEHEEEETDDDDEWEALTSHLRNIDGLVEAYERALGIGPVSTSASSSKTKRKSKMKSINNPFDYLPTNDPSQGLGYDICIECHDLAPFPSSAHIRAAEDHMGVLDRMWRERWERGVNRRRKKRGLAEVKFGMAGSLSLQHNGNGSMPGAPTIQVVPFPSPPRPPPNANAVIHLPFPSSPTNSQATMLALMPVIRFLERWIQPVEMPAFDSGPSVESQSQLPFEGELKMKNLRMIESVDPRRNMEGALSAKAAAANSTSTATGGSGARRWSSVTALLPSFSGLSSNNNSNSPPNPSPSSPLPPHPSRLRSLTSPSPSPSPAQPPTPLTARTRPLKVLLYSSDGYTETSLLALSLLMVIRKLSLPAAYLELQVEKRRSFFVYGGGNEMGVLRRVEGKVAEEREREKDKEKERLRERERERDAGARRVLEADGEVESINKNGKRTAPTPIPHLHGQPSPSARSPAAGYAGMGRPAAKSVSFVSGPPYSAHQFGGSVSAGHQVQQQAPPPPLPLPPPGPAIKGRPRAMTSPWLPSLFGGDHQSWFNDPRFDGSFPSRVLPFLYLGNLNHASNVYMLHALGITHVVSVGECALIPPPHHSNSCYRPSPNSNPHFVPGKGPGGQGSLWIEEREGRIKVLDIQGVCDDGIDTLEPQLEPICEWIDKARQDGGQVLVHCRVGVSRSATVTIAYVMKHLSLPLVDAYLIVRSRRLSVLIQPNMRLLYNLLGWEIKLAKERAGGDERKLKRELSRALTWPCLAREVHVLNEKYLH